MCLDTVTKRFKKPSSRVIKVWKGFVPFKDANVKSLKTGCYAARVPIGRWVKDNPKKKNLYFYPYDKANQTYPSGFHFQRSYDSALGWGIPVRVEVKRVLCLGTQDNDGAGTAQYIRITRAAVKRALKAREDR